MENKFCHFLVKIGIIDKDICSIFLQIYKDMKYENKNLNILELSFHILITFLNNMTNKQKAYLSRTFPLKFFEIRQKLILDKLRSIIITNQLKYKLHLIKYLYKWKFSKRIKSYKSHNNQRNSFIYNQNSKIISSNTTYQIHRQKNLFEKEMSSDNYEKNNISEKVNFNRHFLSNNTTTKNSISNFNFNLINVNSKGKLEKSNSDNITPNKSINIKSYNNSNIIKNIQKTLEYKEQKELKECTFKPKINNLKQSLNLTKSSNKNRNKEIQNRFEKLYRDNEKYNLSKQIKALELDYLINKELTFNPSINNSRHLTRENSKENFETRVKTFLEQKKQHTEEIKNKINLELEKNFSFSPKINTSKISKNNSTNSFFSKTINDKKDSTNYKEMPSYIRLYEESKLRNQKQIQKRKEADELITNLSNNNLKSTILNINKINELYKNKSKAKVDERTKKKVIKEEGLTFKPNLYKNKFAKNIFSTFYERNYKFLEDREKFITTNKNKINHDRIISPKEKKQIVENVIGRLYSDPKSFTITNNGCNRYIKNIKESLTKNLSINNFNNFDYHEHK
jgi:hypothetical protein